MTSTTTGDDERLTSDAPAIDVSIQQPTRPLRTTATSDLSEQIPLRDSLLVAVTAGLGYGFDAYAVNIYGLVLPLIAVSFAVDLTTLGFIGSIFLVGYMVGTIGFGIAADRWGRKDTLGVSILLYGATTSLGGLTANIPLFAALRFLTGVGGAGELAVGAPYTCEMFPPRYRAIGVGGIMFSLFSFGYILAGLAALYIAPRFGWQWTFIIAIVPAIGVFAMRRLVQESVRYAIQKADEKIRAAQQLEQSLSPGSPDRIWRIPVVRKRIGIGWLLYTANAAGYWGLSVFLTTFMVKKFGVSPATAIGYAISFYVAQFFFSYLGTGLSDWRGRRPAGMAGAVLMIATTIVATTVSSLGLFLVFGALMMALLGWLWGVGDTYISELFPTRIRGTGFGLAVGGGRFAAIFAPLLVGAGITAFGPTIPFLASAGLWLLTIIGYLLGPETSRKSIEQIEAEFEAQSKN
ncbi:MFS transporter [Mycobacterium celatum]|uniref:MFS transporter n=1 Tax=Mycobacterium celatum TaxID=28045 RepID=A0A2G5PKY4_MYCCE|nr:MFS transporter [Mycobacterium celatum]PIB78693.1 MFS transporter [Mycobacterium celatum]